MALGRRGGKFYIIHILAAIYEYVNWILSFSVNNMYTKAQGNS